MIKQQKMLERNEREHFTNFSGLPHFELEGKSKNQKTLNGTKNKAEKQTRKQLAKAFRTKPYNVFQVCKDENGDDVYQSLEELLSESDFVSIHCPLKKNQSVQTKTKS